jgi:hypothetical protein
LTMRCEGQTHAAAGCIPGNPGRPAHDPCVAAPSARLSPIEFRRVP